jgi:hypothetical protein
MNEERRDEEQPTFKVADRRKFNIDGSLREGVSLEESKPGAEPAANQAQPQTAEPPKTEKAAPINLSEDFSVNLTADSPPDAASEMSEAEDEDSDELQIPGAENPASFANFLLSLASQTAAAMGLAENPMTGKRTADLEMSRYWLDVLGMLHEKTKGNLHPQEQKLFDGLLGDLRMQFVQLARMAEAQRRKQEENLMKQAAQKFSGKDILGR